MKKVKCLLSILLGMAIGLIASCSRSGEKTPPPVERAPTAPPSADNATLPPAKPAVDNAPAPPPKKGEDLPVRGPMLE